MAHVTFPKPAKGTAFMARKDRRADRVQAEQKVMQAALLRDGRRCRWPDCKGTYRGLTLPVDAAHFQGHRGPGGNPDGSRTERTGQIVSLCRECHRQLDAHARRIDALTDAGADGTLAFYEKQESGKWLHVASETARGVSVAVGQ